MNHDEIFDLLRRLVVKDRSVRRFDGNKPISNRMLENIVELTRYCASGRNLQPMRYRLINESRDLERIYPLLKWAGYLPDWDGPEPAERPAAYIIQCLDTRLCANCLCDDGLQLQTITLGATAIGLGACIIKSFNMQLLRDVLELPEYYEIRYVVALGYPVEEVVIDDMAPAADDIKYYRTPDGVHHVPKRPLGDLLI